MWNNYLIITLTGAFYYFFLAQFKISHFAPNLMLLALFFLIIFCLNNNWLELTLISLYAFLIICQIEFLQIVPLIIVGGLISSYLIYYFKKKFIREISGIYIIISSLLFFPSINLIFFLAANLAIDLINFFTLTLIDLSIAFIIFLFYIFVKNYVKPERKIY